MIARGLLVLLLVLPAVTQAAAPSERPATRVTERMSPAVYARVAAAQEAMEAGDLHAAEQILLELRGEADQHSDYERAQVLNFLAAVHYAQGREEAAAADYEALLALKSPPPQLAHAAMFRLAQLWFLAGDYRGALAMFARWQQAVDPESVRPDALMLKAQAHFQLGEHDAARDAALNALREARRRKEPLRESWLALLRAVYYELGDYRRAARVLRELIRRWPRAEYYEQLAGMLGLMGMQEAQLQLLHAAHAAGLLRRPQQLLDLARLYMASGVPYPAARLLQEAMEAGQIDRDEGTLRLLAQALALARETELQIGVLEELASRSGQAQDYVYLGQAQMALSNWQQAAEAFEQALRVGAPQDAAAVLMQLGAARYNARQLAQAAEAFSRAAAHPGQAEQARRWLAFIEAERRRLAAIGAGP